MGFWEWRDQGSEALYVATKQNERSGFFQNLFDRKNKVDPQWWGFAVACYVYTLNIGLYRVKSQASKWKLSMIDVMYTVIYFDALKQIHFTIQHNARFSQCLLMLNLKSWRWTMDTRCTCEVLTLNQSKTNGRTSVHTYGNNLSIPQYLKDWMCTHDSKA